MATRGPGAAKGRVTARPGARASSARRTTIRSDKARPASRGGAAARKPRGPSSPAEQARERLKFVRPGEVSYTVIGADELQSQQIATGAVAESRPWYDRLWGSIGQADRTDAEPVP
ncbi:MAG: hypothetical protein LC679_15020 [Intrasporangiaceae bacterium]|nr:hypothetical protein [Intrasporangiaceae bacterium]